jgi:hypothetical protein
LRSEGGTRGRWCAQLYSCCWASNGLRSPFSWAEGWVISVRPAGSTTIDLNLHKVTLLVTQVIWCEKYFSHAI